VVERVDRDDDDVRVPADRLAEVRELDPAERRIRERAAQGAERCGQMRAERPDRVRMTLFDGER
jgi:hypothetical protein